MALTFVEAIEEVDDPSVDPITLEKWLREHAPDIADLVRKDFTATDTHVPTALGNERDRGKKRRKIPAVVGETKHKDDGGEGTNTDVGKIEITDDADGNVHWKMSFPIVKSVPDQRLAFGWASIATKNGLLVVDKQDDMIDPQDLEKAAYDFVLYCRNQNDMHQRQNVGRLVESMMFTKEKQDKLRINLGLEGWWVGFKVDDESVWKAIKDGDRPEFSIGGRAERVEI